jgi:probable F420-dependent oxidoreductase
LAETDVLELAPAIERLGFHGMTFPDHVFTPLSGSARYPYSDDGRPPFAPDTPWPDSIVLIAAVGARTSTLALMTAVTVLSLRHPLLFAKAATTAARICDGRLTLGVGAGWQPEECAAVGVDFERRGAVLTDAILAMRCLWGEQPASYSGAYFSFGPLLMEPGPPTIAVIVGGGSDAALRRAVRVGDGWIMPSQPLAAIPAQLQRLRAALDAADRGGDTFRVFVPCLGARAEQIAPILEPEVTDITVMPWPHAGAERTTVREKVAHAERWLAEVLAPLQALAAEIDAPA